MNYQIKILNHAKRQVKSISKYVQEQIKITIKNLGDNPRPVGVIKLSGKQDLYRVRVGDYRIIYQIEDNVLLIIIVSVGHRREIYRNM
jgi:mRNA interferase RelE/StbE